MSGLLLEVKGLDVDSLGFFVKLHHVQYTITVVATVKRGITGWRSEYALQGKVQRRRELQSPAKVLAQLPCAMQTAIRPAPAPDNCARLKNDTIGIMRHDAVQ